MDANERRKSSIEERKIILLRLEKLENALIAEKTAVAKSKYDAKYLRARIHRKQRDQKAADWKNTHPLA